MASTLHPLLSIEFHLKCFPIFFFGSGDVNTAKQIVEAGTQIDMTSKQGMTPLCMAVAGGHTEVVKLLLDSNADPNMAGPLAGSGDPGE